MSDTPESPTRVVSVEIQGLRYPIRSDLDEQYIIRLAAYVDAKMTRATARRPITRNCSAAPAKSSASSIVRSIACTCDSDSLIR